MTRKKTDNPIPKSRGAIASDDSAAVESPRVPVPSRVRPGMITVELIGLADTSFNTVDPLTGRSVSLRLIRGENSVPSGIFSAFRDDPFFRDHILGKVVVDKTPPDDDPGEVVEL